MLRIPGSGAFFDPWIGMGKKSGSGSGIRILDKHPDHISESLETIVLGENTSILFCGFGIRDGKNSDTG
jgi:hypothetical protein